MLRLTFLILTTFVVTLSIASCVPYGATTSPQLKRSAAPTTYEPVDFAKWASGLYPDEFFGKSVVVDGYYNRSPLAGMNISDSISFSVSEKSTQELQREAMASARRGEYIGLSEIHVIPVVAPISMRDTFYKLQPGSRIRVYGQVINPYSRSVFHGRVVSSSLQVQAQRVQVL